MKRFDLAYSFFLFFCTLERLNLGFRKKNSFLRDLLLQRPQPLLECF